MRRSVFAAALLALLRQRFHPSIWRLAHTALILVAVTGSIAHAMLIEGTMETVTKTLLCVLVLTATLHTVVKRRAWTTLQRPRS